MSESVERKLERLRRNIRKLDSALIAFSGGVDSSFLLRVCREELGEKAVAVTTLSSDYPKSELSIARRVAKIMGARHIAYDPSDTQISADSDIYSSLKSLAMRMRLKNVLDGSHKDDEKDSSCRYKAARKAGLVSPLLESNLTKAEIRVLSRKLGLPNWDKPESNSTSIRKARKYLERMGVKKAILRSRARKLYIYTTKSNLMKIIKELDKIKKKMRSLGFEGVFAELS